MAGLPLSDSKKSAVSRRVGLGIPEAEIAAEFGISVRDVQRIDVHVRQARADSRVAEPLPGPRIPDWKTARPAEERLRTGETCRAPDGCGERIHKGSYCVGHSALFHKARAA